MLFVPVTVTRCVVVSQLYVSVGLLREFDSDITTRSAQGSVKNALVSHFRWYAGCIRTNDTGIFVSYNCAIQLGHCIDSEMITK